MRKTFTDGTNISLTVKARFFWSSNFLTISVTLLEKEKGNYLKNQLTHCYWYCMKVIVEDTCSCKLITILERKRKHNSDILMIKSWLIIFNKSHKYMICQRSLKKYAIRYKHGGQSGLGLRLSELCYLRNF